MKYSKALIVSIEEAQQLASHFESEYLESWHLLIAFSNYPYSVAGSVLNDYPLEIDHFEDAAYHVVGKSYQKEGQFSILPFSHRLTTLFKEAKAIAEATHAKEVGTEHILYAIISDRGTLATRILEFVGFSYEDKEGVLRINDLRRNGSRTFTQLRHFQVTYQHTARSCFYCFLERVKFNTIQTGPIEIQDRQSLVRIHLRISMSGKMFAYR